MLAQRPPAPPTPILAGAAPAEEESGGQSCLLHDHSWVFELVLLLVVYLCVVFGSLTLFTTVGVPPLSPPPLTWLLGLQVCYPLYLTGSAQMPLPYLELLQARTQGSRFAGIEVLTLAPAPVR